MLSVKCADRFYLRVGKDEYQGHVPKDLGIGGGDYVRLRYCLKCGQIQAEFPIHKGVVDALFQKENEGEDEEWFDPALYDERGDGDNRI